LTYYWKSFTKDELSKKKTMKKRDSLLTETQREKREVPPHVSKSNQDNQKKDRTLRKAGETAPARKLTTTRKSRRNIWLSSVENGRGRPSNGESLQERMVNVGTYAAKFKHKEKTLIRKWRSQHRLKGQKSTKTERRHQGKVPCQNAGQTSGRREDNRRSEA